MIATINQRCRVSIGWPVSTGIDPLSDDCNLVRCETWCIGRHAFVWVGRGDQLHQRTVGGATGDDTWSVRFATTEGFGANVETQIGFLFFCSVAGVAMLLKNGPNVFNKVDRLSRAGGSSRQSQQNK